MWEGTASRLTNYVLSVGAVVTGALLVWIGATTHELSKQQAVTADRVESIRDSQTETKRSVDAATVQVGQMSLRLQRVEDRVEIRNREQQED